MTGKIRVVYAGYHSETLLLLIGDTRFDVTGTGLIEEFLTVKTLNPVNLLFKIIYGLRYRNKFRFLERILLCVWKLTSGFSTSFYYSYRDYLKALSECRIELVDLSNRFEAADYVTTNRVDLLVVCSWSILAEDIIFLPRYGTINIHPSKLPQYRGAVPTLWTLKHGDRESAVTYLVMDKTIDGGAIIGQHTFPIGDSDDWYSVELKINDILRTTLLSEVMGYIAGEIKPSAQDMRAGSKTGTYNEYMKIDWDNENGKAIYNKVNLYPFLVPDDYCHTFLNGRKIAFKNASYLDNRVVLPKAGQYHVLGLTLLIQANHGVIACRLFSGLRVKDSILFLLHRKGEFI